MAEALTVQKQIMQGLQGIVGKAAVLTDDTTLQQYGQDESWMPPKRPDWVVRVQDMDQVQKVVQLANGQNIPVVPRSSGVGFHGSGIPEEGGIILDMRGMKRVLRVDTRNKWALVEPGVTYGQLQQELEPQGFRPVTPLLPHPQKSVITSLLEKNPGLSSKMHLDEIILTMQLILPTGERFRTGSLAVPVPGLRPEEVPDNTHSDLCNALGPGIDWWRLLTGSEGAFAVVTAMNFKIVPLPAKRQIYFLPAETLEALVEPTYLLLRKEVGNECFILNRHNLASALGAKEDDLGRLKEHLPPFCLIICLDAGEWYPEEKIAYQEQVLREVCQRCNCLPGTQLPPLREADRKVADILSLAASDGVYWKFRHKGGCWDILLLTPLERAAGWMTIVREVAAAYGYPFSDIGVYLQPKQRGRAYHLEFSFPVDRNSERECDTVRTILHEATKRLMNAGAFLYRPYGSLAPMVYPRTGNLHHAIRKIKNILDPGNVLNPGKLAL